MEAVDVVSLDDDGAVVLDFLDDGILDGLIGFVGNNVNTINPEARTATILFNFVNLAFKGSTLLEFASPFLLVNSRPSQDDQTDPRGL